MTRRIPDDVRKLLDIPEDEWSSWATTLVWPIERHHVQRYFTDAMRCKSVRAFNYELSRGGFRSAVFIFAFNYWTRWALIFTPTFLVFGVLAASSSDHPGRQASQFAIQWVSGALILLLIGLGTLRLLHGRRRYGSLFVHQVTNFIDDQRLH